MSKLDWGDWEPLLLTLKLAGATTILLLAIGLPLAAWLAGRKSLMRQVVDVLVAMPLVLPPSVLGFYLLLVFSPGRAPGRWLDETFGLRLVFSFSGLLVGSMIFSLPFMVQPLKNGMEALPPLLREAAWTMGRSRCVTFFRVILPNIKGALLSGVVMTFAHTIGEFGVVLMIGGNIPGETRVASIAIYDEVEAMNYGAAHAHAVILVALSFGILLVLHAPKWLSLARITGGGRGR